MNINAVPPGGYRSACQEIPFFRSCWLRRQCEARSLNFAPRLLAGHFRSESFSDKALCIPRPRRTRHYDTQCMQHALHGQPARRGAARADGSYEDCSSVVAKGDMTPGGQRAHQHNSITPSLPATPGHATGEVSKRTKTEGCAQCSENHAETRFKFEQ